MIHTMKLQEEYFYYIKNGTKKYEIRLNDEKRQKIKVGDFIEFQKEPLLEEKIITKVTNLIYFPNFEKLFENIDIRYLADKNVKKEKLIEDLEVYYPKEKQEKYGVLAIEVKLQDK